MTSNSMKGGEEYLDSIFYETQLSEDMRYGCRMPLLLRRKDKNGHPITTVQYVSRYAESDQDGGFPLIENGGYGKDSVEAIGCYSITVGQKIIGCYYYSLSSFNDFSYEHFLEILNSIKVTIIPD